MTPGMKIDMFNGQGVSDIEQQTYRNIRLTSIFRECKKFMADVEKVSFSAQLTSVRQMMATALGTDVARIQEHVNKLHADVKWKVDSDRLMPITSMKDGHLQNALVVAREQVVRKFGTNPGEHWLSRCHDTEMVVAVALIAYELLANRRVSLKSDGTAVSGVRVESVTGQVLPQLTVPRPQSSMHTVPSSSEPTRNERAIE